VTATAAAVASRERVERLLCTAGLYRPARNTYHRLVNREQLAERERARAFFRRFVRPGSLVFDIGANHGRLAETHLELGARVVAIEPNRDLADRIRRRYGSALAVENVAVGAAAGFADLHLGKDDGHSTLSPAWMARAPTGARWNGLARVPVTTLDALISRYGEPQFVKIDVEGFEAEVLSGLHRPLPLLSFEFQCAELEIARRCVERLSRLGRYAFNLTQLEELRLLRGEWTNGATLVAELERMSERNPTGYGDVYAALCGAGSENQP